MQVIYVYNRIYVSVCMCALVKEEYSTNEECLGRQIPTNNVAHLKVSKYVD